MYWISPQHYSKKLNKLQLFSVTIYLYREHIKFENFKAEQLNDSSQLSYSIAKTIDHSENTGMGMVKVDWISQQAYSKKLKKLQVFRGMRYF